MIFAKPSMQQKMKYFLNYSETSSNKYVVIIIFSSKKWYCPSATRKEKLHSRIHLNRTKPFYIV